MTGRTGLRTEAIRERSAPGIWNAVAVMSGRAFSMQVLIPGACGFAGSSLASWLIEINTRLEIIGGQQTYCQ